MSSDNDYQKFWQEYDNGETDELLLTKSNLCQKMMDLADSEQKRFIQFELNLLYFYLWIHSYLENVNGFELSQIQDFIREFRGRCNQETLSYYEKRFNETPSLLNKSKYAIGYWYLSNDSKYLIDSIDLIIKSADDRNKEPADQVHYLISAFNLSRIYNLKQFNHRISELALKLFYHFSTEPRWMIEPTEIFVQLNSLADYNLINNMISNLHHEAYKFLTNDNFHLHQSLLEASLPLSNLTNLDNSMKEKLRNEIQTMIANSHEIDAQKRWDKNEAMVAVIFFEKAKTIYEKIGNNKKVDEINNKIRDSTQDIEWKEFKHNFSMPELKLKGNTSMELINSICNFREKFPNLKNIEQQALEQLKNNPLMNAVSRTTFNLKNPISHDSDENSTLKSEIRRLTIWHIQLAENWLSLAVKKLEEENKISSEDYIKFFEDRKIYNTDQFTILKSGIENHFKSDHIASIHTLIPQIEGTLRIVLSKKGLSTLKTKRDIIMDNELGGILNNPETTKILGVDLIHYLKTKYSDPTGINQRNEVSHALAPISNFNHANSLSIIQDLMVLNSI